MNPYSRIASLLTLLSWGLVSATSNAAIINVPDDIPTIQGAIDAAAVSGDEIIVEPGTYNEVINFLGKAINLHSASGNPADTIIDGTGLNDSVVLCISGEGAGTVLEGFTITGGTGHTDEFGNNSGGGMFIDGSSPTVTNCSFIANDVPAFGNGGGMCNVFSSSPRVTNCIFGGNTTFDFGRGGGMYNDCNSNPTVTNCTFNGNSAFFGGGMANFNGSSPTVTNCILWVDSPDEIFNVSSIPTISNSNVLGDIGAGSINGGGNFSINPHFVDADGPDNIPGTLDDNLRLASHSPCTDSGDNTTPGLTGIPIDLDGNPRFFDDIGVVDTGNGVAPIVDMGAYERQANSPPPPPPVIINVPADFATIQAAINAASAISGDEIIVAPGIYHEVINFIGKAVYLHSASGNPADTIIDGTGLNDSVVLCIIGEGADAVMGGFTITGGVGHPIGVFGKRRGGGMFNNGSSPMVTNCNFSGNTAFRGGGGMFNDSSSPTVTNCTFSGNSTIFGGGGIFNENSSPTITNCTLSGNSAGGNGGGGMLNISSNPAVTNCTFSGNSAVEPGGGMASHTSSSPVVTNCTFSGNSAFIGGGMFNAFSGNPMVINCTFSGNTASGSGGGMWNSFINTTVSNCILWGDSPDEIFNSTSTSTISFSNVQGGLRAGSIDGGGNINIDPLFIDADGADNIPGTPDDDLRLASGSPNIDAGDNTALPIEITTDLDGAPRFVDDPATPDTGNGAPGTPIVDMGAYEFQSGLLAHLDIEPGECPNEFKPRLGNDDHRIKIALVGTAEFSVNQVDVSTILLARADGIGGTVLPNRVRIRDRATPFHGDPCGCHELKKDGVPDLMMRFFSADMTAILELANLPEGVEVELILTGTLFDGAPFSARDCITIESPSDDD